VSVGIAVSLVLCRWFWCGVEGGDMSAWDDKGFRFLLEERTVGSGPKSVDVLRFWVAYRYVIGEVVGGGGRFCRRPFWTQSANSVRR
jgi:hypothetical protein